MCRNATDLVGWRRRKSWAGARASGAARSALSPLLLHTIINVLHPPRPTSSAAAASLSDLLPPTGGHAFRILPAGEERRSAAATAAIRGWKLLCDELLPALRSRGHLHNVIYRHKANASIVLCGGAADEAASTVLGGATFRLIHNTREKIVILDVLLLAVAQRPGVCGMGHATRIINALKSLLLQRASSLSASPLLLTQADLGEQALAFWGRQGLREGPRASSLLRSLHAASPKEHIVYDYTVPMLLPLPRVGWRCTERQSKRAQELNEEDEDEEEEAVATGAASSSSSNARQSSSSSSGQPVRLLRAPICLHCGKGTGEMLRCDLCSRWCHLKCAAAAVAELDEDDEVAESLTCRECAKGLSNLRIGAEEEEEVVEVGGGSGSSRQQPPERRQQQQRAPALFDAVASHLAKKSAAAAAAAAAAEEEHDTEPEDEEEQPPAAAAAAAVVVEPPPPPQPAPAPAAPAKKGLFGGAFPSRAEILQQKQQELKQQPSQPAAAAAAPATTKQPAQKAATPRRAASASASSSSDAIALSLWTDLIEAMRSAYPEPQIAAGFLNERAQLRSGENDHHGRGGGLSMRYGNGGGPVQRGGRGGMQQRRGASWAPGDGSAAAALAEAAATAMQRTGALNNHAAAAHGQAGGNGGGGSSSSQVCKLGC